MDPLWLILPMVLVLCSEAENLIQVTVAQGQNATLNCSVDMDSVFWYVEMSCQNRVLIARTFGPGPDEAKFSDPTYRTKYMAFGRQMVVTNITADDYRFYFCASKTDTFRNLTTFRLLSDVPISPCTNDSEANRHHHQQHIGKISHNELVVYGSFALNAVLILVIIGLGWTSLRLKRKNSSNQVNDASPLTYEDPETLNMSQYEEIQLGAPPQAAPPFECIYYKAQLPGSMPPQHN